MWVSGGASSVGCLDAAPCLEQGREAGGLQPACAGPSLLRNPRFASWAPTRVWRLCTSQRPQRGTVTSAWSEAPAVCCPHHICCELAVWLDKAAEAALTCLQSRRGTTSHQRRR